MSESQKTINDFLESDRNKLVDLIREYPGHVSVAKIAEFLGTTGDSVRAAVEAGTFGMSWKKTGVNNRGFFVPTPQFVRWYLNGAGLW